MSRRSVFDLALLSSLVAVCVTVAAPAVAVELGAYELLDQIRRAYGELEFYRDSGEIESIQVGENGEHRDRYRFTTVLSDDRFVWHLDQDTDEGAWRRVFWRRGAAAFVYDEALQQELQAPSLVAELLRGFGPGGLDALAVPALLAGASGAFAEAEAAAVDGPESCGEEGDSCWVLTLSRMGAALETRIWIERQSGQIPRVEVELYPQSGAPSRMIVEHRVEVFGADLPPEAAAFVPPPSVRRVERWQVDDEAGDVLAGFADEITVDHLTIVARAVDRLGHALPDLRGDDFVARLRRREIPIAAVDWVSPYRSWTAELSESERAELATAGVDLASSGRLVVFFVQADFHAVRIKGQLRLLPYARELLATFHPDDQVAVVAFDSHLKLWLDFTADREAVATTLEQAIRFGARPPPRRSRRRSVPSLGASFDVAASRRVTTPERALQVMAEAMAPLPGEKDVVYLGWGLGRFDLAGVRMTAEYRPAVDALHAARATVFVLDITNADRHDLEVGLMSVAESTGGTYAKVNNFAAAALATRRLAQVRTGYYLLTLDMSGLSELSGRVDIGLRHNRGGEVLFSPIVWR